MRSSSTYSFVVKAVIFLVPALFFSSGCEESVKIVNSRPAVQSIVKDVCYAEMGTAVNIVVTAMDADGDELSYSWSATGGSFQSFSDGGAKAVWIAPGQPGVYLITVNVTDEIDEVSSTISVDVCGPFPSAIGADTVITDPGYKFILKRTTRLVVPEGVSLTLNRGVTVVVSSEYGGLEVRGRLEVNGVKGDEVVFIPNSCEEGTGLWGGIYFVGPDAEGQIRHLFVSSGKDGIDVSDGAVVTLSNCTSYNNSGIGLSVVDSAVAHVDSCKIWDNSKGVFVRYSYVELRNSSVRYNEYNGLEIIADPMDPPIVVERCVVANNVGNGVVLRNRANPEIHYCSLFNNGVDTNGYALMLISYTAADSVRAEMNYWGLEMDSRDEINELIYDAEDDPSIDAYVDFEPWLEQSPVTAFAEREYIERVKRRIRSE